MTSPVIRVSLIRVTALHPIRTLLNGSKAFIAFAAASVTGGRLLIAAALMALIWANSDAANLYQNILETPLGARGFAMPVSHWVNDGLMAIFFLLVGVELKRELLVGELASPAQAMLPIFGALGGMAVPAAIYAALCHGSEAIHGWAIPMATDIAFALAAVSVLGARVPVGLKVFLTALAIVDDLGAIIVIALFYTAQLNLQALAAAGGIVAALMVLNRCKVQTLWLYLLLGLLLWIAVHASGLHATLAGVMLAFTLPLTDRDGNPDTDDSVAHRVETRIQPLVNYAILPLFALCNTGLPLGDVAFGTVTAGVSLGLLVGKPLGVTAASWLAVKSGFASLPENTNWRGMLGVGLLAGIGFTMSLFVANLSFAGLLYDEARLGILIGSIASAAGGLAVLLAAGEKRPPIPAGSGC